MRKQKNAKLNPRDSLARDLVLLFYPQRNLLINLVDDEQFSTTGTHQLGVYGEELYNNNDNGIISSINIGDEYSAFTFASYNNSTTDHAIANVGGQDPTIWADTDTTALTPVIYAGTMIGGTYNSVSTGYHCWGGTMRSNDASSSIFVDGAKQNSGNPGAWTPGTYDLNIHNGPTGNTSKSSDGRHVWTAVWKRKLTDDEAHRLTANPFYINRLLQRPQRVIAKAPVAPTIIKINSMLAAKNIRRAIHRYRGGR